MGAAVSVCYVLEGLLCHGWKKNHGWKSCVVVGKIVSWVGRVFVSWLEGWMCHGWKDCVYGWKGCVVVGRTLDGCFVYVACRECHWSICTGAVYNFLSWERGIV